MPFLHEGVNGNVTITPTQLSITELKPSLGNSASLATARGISPGSARLHRIIQREVAGGASFYNNHHNSSSNGGNNQNQRLAAQRKLQLAKMMSNGGGGMSAAALSNFHRPPQHGHQSQSPLNSQQQLDRNDPMFVSSRRARSNNFTLKETFDLLKVWASTEIQWNMKHNFRNFRVWEAISFQMSELGHDRTAIQCKNRIQNLTSIFYRIKKSKQDYRSFNFPYYKLIGDVLDGKKSTGSLGPNSQGNLSAFTIGNDYANMSNISPATQNAAGFAAHLALVEEYQHLINGQPEVYATPPGGRSSSNNSNSGLNVLSPEVSLSEGGSPVRVDTQRSGGTHSSTPVNSQISNSSNAKNNPSTSRNGPTSGSGLPLPTALLKIEHDDSVNVTMEDGTLGSEVEQDTEANSDLDEQMGDDDNADGHMDDFPPPRGKRSYSMFGSFKPGGGNPAKRARGLSSQSSISGTYNIPDDPIAHYLAEMVDIEKQWLELERERASNEQRMMTYMMQIMQALVSPTPGTDEEEGDTEQDADNDDGDVDAFDETEDDPHEDEAQLRQMIDNENEDTLPNGSNE